MPRHFLEWICALFLSQDKVGIEEQLNNVDVHSSNQQRFGLPDRLTAKTYLFRLIYGGSAYSYSVDPDFIDVSTSPKFWQRIIDQTYAKYRGLEQWHTALVAEAMERGKVTVCTGREYYYKPLGRGRDGSLNWPRTTILNYPVQGLGADVMALIRVQLFRYLKEFCPEALMVCTVHDSVLIDAREQDVDKVIDLCFKTFEVFPANWKRIFGMEWNVPLKVEVQYGPTWGEMKEVERN